MARKQVTLVNTGYALGLVKAAISKMPKGKRLNATNLAKWKHQTAAELTEIFGPQSSEVQQYEKIVWPLRSKSPLIWTSKAIEAVAAAEGVLAHIRKRLEMEHKREMAAHESTMRTLQYLNKSLEQQFQPPKLTAKDEAP